MKICSKCKVEQSESSFTRDKSRDDGLFPHCKSCRKVDRHRYYCDHKDEIMDKSMQWHKNNPDGSKAIKKRYRDTHKEEIAANIQEARETDPDRFKKNSQRSYYKNRKDILERQSEYRKQYPDRIKTAYRKHRETFRERMNEQRRQWYTEHKSVHNQRVRNWASRNPRKRLSYVHTRRARRLENGGRYTSEQWEMLKQQYGYKCLCCGETKPLTVDHVIPIARGGSNDISNIQPLCIRCNKSKATKSTDYRKELIS